MYCENLNMESNYEGILNLKHRITEKMVIIILNYLLILQHRSCYKYSAQLNLSLSSHSQNPE